MNTIGLTEIEQYFDAMKNDFFLRTKPEILLLSENYYIFGSATAQTIIIIKKKSPITSYRYFKKSSKSPYS